MNTDTRRPRDPESWEQRYVENQLPWDSGKPDTHLQQVIAAHGIQSDTALEIGCGTGTNSIWLAKHGFRVTGLDLSLTAITRAEAKAADARVDCHFFCGDFLTDPIPGGPYEFVYDRGCFHVFDGAEDRADFASRVAQLLSPEGIWHSLIGSTDGPPRDTGPPRRSVREIAAAVEPSFEILELRSTTFDSESHRNARAWVLAARRRILYSE